MDEEHQRLVKKILQHENQEKIEPLDTMQIGAQIRGVGETTDYVEDRNKNMARGPNNWVIKVEASISVFYSKSLATNVCIDFYPGKNVICEKQSLHYDQLSFAGTPFTERLEFYCWNDVLPSTTLVKVSGSFHVGETRELRTFETEFHLPLALFTSLAPPQNVKEPNKITLATNQQALTFSDLYEDIISSQNARGLLDQTPNAVSFQF